LGTHQLKDLAAPERVWQLTHPQMKTSVADVEEKAAPVVAPYRAYLLTDHQNRTEYGFEWGANVGHSVEGLKDEDARIYCYTTPKLAALLNALNERVRMARLWEATIDHDPLPGDAKVACMTVRSTRQVQLPTPTAVDFARFAVVCAQAASSEVAEFS